MIKINLLPARKKATRQARGEQTLLIGLGAIAALAVIVFFAVHRPMSVDLDERKVANRELVAKNKKVEDQIKGLGNLRASIKAAQEQNDAIKRLNAARAVPAWFLYELSRLTTPGGTPSMTEAMVRELDRNPNRNWSDTWDPKHVWILRISEKDGIFSIEGGAQSDSDVTQLALRLQASMFFDDVQPSKAGLSSDGGKIPFYSFVITGKVRY